MVCDSERQRSPRTGAVLLTGGVVVSLAHASASRADRHSAPPTPLLPTGLLKLVALCNRLGVHGLLRSLIVAFLAIAVRSNSGFRTAIIRMLVFHRSTSALPVHN